MLTPDIIAEADPLSWRFWRKRRYIVVLLAFFGYFNMYTLRTVLSIGIVAMTEKRTIFFSNGTIGYASIGNKQKKQSIKNVTLFAGTRLFMGFQRSWIDFKLVFLGLHIDEFHWWHSWLENWRKFGNQSVYHSFIELDL